ncbi:hypothetical protein EAH88_11705 [Rhodanobacter glycinis]|uniref:Uncharacterized protein n=1 Tax=Rhodanobacter glycinis TaxID=582702 RepID=A0A502C667_9GAMM|nr:hypothetical protein [Rhodanobacter glycinis]TPG08292.1 hypothetical protein EAH88_11705 [Rhodanobacter glycinis]
MNAQTLTTIEPELRAAQLLSFDETKAELTSLAKQSERITQITNKAGRDECHSSLMVLKGRRVDIEKRGKEARDDANKFAKAVIAKEKELIGFIAPEEERLQLLRDQWDTAAEVARLEKLEAERLRVEAIQQKIQQIRDVPPSLVGKPSVIIAGQLAKLRETVLDEDELGADYITATDALTAAIARVEQLLATQQESDAEKKRQAERDAEMEAMRKQQAEMQARLDQAEAERVERERKAAAEEAGRIAREAAEKRQAEIEAQRRVQTIRDRITSIVEMAVAINGRPSQWLQDTLGDLDNMRPSRDADSFDQFIGEASTAWDEARDKIEAEIEVALLREKAEADAQAEREAEDVRLQAERERQAAAQKKLDEQAAKLKRDQQAAAAKAEADRLANLGLREAAEAVVDFFRSSIGQYPVVCDLAAALTNDEATTKPARAKKVARA